jgi:transposase
LKAFVIRDPLEMSHVIFQTSQLTRQQMLPLSVRLTGNQWDSIAPFVTAPPGSRRTPHRVDLREVVNAILYLVRTGCAWRQPHDFPAWQTVYGYFRRWRKEGTLQRMHDALREAGRRTRCDSNGPASSMPNSCAALTPWGPPHVRMTPGRKSRAASAISWSIPAACSWLL